MLLGLALLWVLHRTGLIPRMVLGSAALGILCLALVRPDAVVAHADVIRYRGTGEWDIGYISRLSADAVPAIDRLPEPLRAQSLAAWRQQHAGGDQQQASTGERPAGRPDGGWASWNLSRWRAERVLAPGNPSS